MADFDIRGDPGRIRTRAATMEQKGTLFFDTGDALGKIDARGWTGRAADHFRDAHDLEPERWRQAGRGFKRAAAALTTYADALAAAQDAADAAAQEHDRGDRESVRARDDYAAYLGRMQTYWASGGTQLADPFVDWGQSIRDSSLVSLRTIRADLDDAAAVCAHEVRAGCADAPEEPNWLESGLRFVGGIFEGAGEAIWDLLTMSSFSPVTMVIDHYKLATGELTPEELMTKYRLSLETAWDMATGIYTGLTTDPVGFGITLGKSLLDWDTWADDPARALGHLLPDAVAAALTGGTGAIATRGTKAGLDALDALADLTTFRRVDDAPGLGLVDDLDDARIYSMTDGVPHRTTFAPEQLGGYRIDDVLAGHGVSRQEAIDLINKPAAELTPDERSLLTSIRDDLPAPDADTVMQKVVDQPYFDEEGRLHVGGADNYVDGTYSPEIRGSVTVADDSVQLGTPRSINEGLRLDYDGTHHSPGDASSHVIRFQAETPDFEVPRNKDMTGSPTNYDHLDDPFTGNGFTKSTDDIVPEYMVPRGQTVQMKPGAELWEVTDTGTQRLVAVLGRDGWVRQGN